MSLGTDVGGLTQCSWEENNYMWSSGAITSLEICLYDLELATIGNDFALDDISLYAYCTSSDTVAVTSLAYDSIATFDTICQGDSILINGTWRSEIGVYIDTLPSGICGTISIAEIAVLTYDSIFQSDTICNGDSI